MKPAREEDDGGGGGELKDCFAKDFSFVIFLLVFFFFFFFFLDWICCLKVFLIVWDYELFFWFV